MNNNGILRGNNVVKLIPDQSVLKLSIGDAIRISAEDFERLAPVFLEELERKFLQRCRSGVSLSYARRS